MKISFPRFRPVTLLFLLICCSLLLLSGCSSKPVATVPQSNASDNQTITIATSFYPMYIMTINVCQNIPGVKVVNMTQPYTGCLHDYQLTTNDVKTLEKSQIFIINGAGIESFMDKVIKQQPDLKIITASQGIPLIQGSGEIGENPHVWVSIAYAIQEVKNIGVQMIALDPAHASQYRSNTASYVVKLESLRNKMHQELNGTKNVNIVTFHEAFPYFALEFSLNIVAVIEREPGSEPSASELAATIKLVKDSNVQALFIEPQYPARTAEIIARETGARIYTLDPAVTGPPDADAYINIMEANLITLKEALK